MRALARRLQAEKGLGLIIVDYLQLMEPRNAQVTMVQQMTEISRSLKSLARELNVPLDWTWSCYSDGKNPCGQCSNCLKRLEAFRELGFSEDLLSS